MRRCILILTLVLSACTDDPDTAVPQQSLTDDADGDGVKDAAEAALGTDPNNPDTDGDGRLDGVEVALGTSPLAADPVCVEDAYSADLRTRPVDVIFVLDNSGSMREEIESVERNINQNFAAIMDQAGLDYRVVMLSKHGEGTPFDSDICVSAPLSNSTCDPVPAQPANSERFFHYDREISSGDSFREVLSTYNQRDPNGFAPSGWSAWLRDDAFKVFIEISDDEPDSPSAESFDSSLLSLTPPKFGTPGNRNYVWHSIVGIYPKETTTSAYTANEPLQPLQCQTAEKPGLEYQKLSVVTGGLRYPVCSFETYDSVFNAAAVRTIEDADIDCSLRLPIAPSGKRLNLEKSALQLRDDSGIQRTITRVPDAGGCAPDAFFVTSESIELCPQLCRTVEGLEKGSLTVFSDCATQTCDNPQPERCDDGIDNDCDGYVDRADFKCFL
ncbi:MAG: hypothetical protein R3E66_11160 [bacterium]